MTDPDLLRAAVEASGLSARRFGERVLGVDERTVRRWAHGQREMSGPVRVLCGLLAAGLVTADDCERAREGVAAAA
jgi:DNA-binding transcriptional regulator YiaG